MAEIPIMTVNVSGNYNIDALKEYADFIEDELENVPEVSKIDMKGQQEREMKIDMDLHKMQSLEVSFDDVENAIFLENMNMSAGEIIKDGFRRTVRIVGEFESEKEIQEIIIKSERQRPIYLKDILPK